MTPPPCYDRGTLLISTATTDRGSTSKIRIQLMQSQEWWDEIAGAKLYLMRLDRFADGSCQTVDHEGHARSFESHARAENWLLEDEYSRISSLIEEGELPPDFKVPGDEPRPVELQPAMDREFFASLGPERDNVRCARTGCSNGAIEMSTLCRLHHFENVMRRPYIY